MWRAPVSTGPSGTPEQLQARPARGERAELVGDRRAEALAAGEGDGAGEHDQGRVDDGDQRGDAEGEPVTERREQLVTGAGSLVRGADGGGRGRGAGCRVTGPAPAPAGPPASSWNAPALPRRTSRTSGVPGSGRKPTSPAPPVTPPWRRPSMTIAAPRPSSTQSRTKSSTPRARPDSSSATAARFTSLSTWTGTPTASASRSSRCGSCQPGQVAGVAQPPRVRVERTGCPDGDVVEVPGAEQPAAVATPSRADITSLTASGPGRRGVRSSYSPTMWPVMSATAASDARRGDVERRHVGGVGVHGVQLGAGTGTAVRAAARHDEVGVLEPAQQLGGGRLGEPGAARRAGSATEGRAPAGGRGPPGR